MLWYFVNNLQQCEQFTDIKQGQDEGTEKYTNDKVTLDENIFQHNVASI